MKKNILLKLDNINQHFTEKNKIILFVSGIILFGSINTSPTSALDYQSSQLVSFTFNPTVQITISDNLTIPSLSPGDSKDSNIITVTASSNAIAGYTLSSTVGSSTGNASTELRKDGTSTTHKFDSITTNKSSLSDFTGNDWGYSYSTDSGTTWQSGDITGTPASGYNGLPLYTTETPIKLINSTDASTNSIQFKIGASATSTQVAGEYTNVINFIGVANPNPPTFDDLFLAAGKTKYNGYYTMQDMSTSICNNASQGSTTQLIDIRDGEVYMISKLKDDRCWLLDNLRLGGTTAITLTSTDTNIAAGTNYSLPPSVTGAFGGYTNANIKTTYKDDIAPVTYGNGSGKIGVYYNYCTASAGTYCYDENAGVGNAIYDICPASWRIPTGGDGGEYQMLNSLYGNNLRTALSTPLSGNYYGYTQYNLGAYGRFWSSNFYNSNVMFFLTAHWSSINPMSTDDLRLSGLSVRCIAK